MSIPRGEPYVWVSWLAKLLAGEAHCQWALWFRAHHRYDKVPSDLDAAGWCVRHAALVGETEQALREEGWKVWVEDQNKFTIRGRTATLAGKPDLVAIKGEVVRVIDCKTGSRKGSDFLQVLIYLLLLPRVHPECRGKLLSGEVRYFRDDRALRHWGLGNHCEDNGRPRSFKALHREGIPGDRRLTQSPLVTRPAAASKLTLCPRRAGGKSPPRT
jgi:PD-(D/E)XK nuclease superfamily